MKAQLIKIAGTEKYPFACIIEVDNIYVTDRITNKEKANKVVSFIEQCNDIKALRLKLAMASIELKIKL